MDFSISHPAVRTYLEYVENTESPRLYHVWAFLSGVSACMGRRCFLPFLDTQIYPNMYVLLSGPPGVRKSTALNIMKRLLITHTGVKFAPDDTGGQRQGFLRAMTTVLEEGSNDDDAKIIEALSEKVGDRKNDGNYVTLADIQNNVEALGSIRFDTRDPRTMYIAASELNSILGEGNTALLTFLQKMWDGEEYNYQLKEKNVILSDALLGMIGATTPAQIALSMPVEAVGQGFTSRCLFIYADKKYARRIARPGLNKTCEAKIIGSITKVFNEFDGAFKETKETEIRLDAIYERSVVIQDPRFVHYTDRRHTHLQKICMAAAAARGSQVIELLDVEFADQLLMLTEEGMSDALGEYGMNKLSAAKQKLMEFLRNCDESISVNQLFALLSRDMSKIEFENTVRDLQNAGKLTVHTLPNKGQVITPISDSPARKARKDIAALEAMLTQPFKVVKGGLE